jgi:hypothetical protein
MSHSKSRQNVQTFTIGKRGLRIQSPTSNTPNYLNSALYTAGGLLLVFLSTQLYNQFKHLFSSSNEKLQHVPANELVPRAFPFSFIPEHTTTAKTLQIDFQALDQLVEVC